MKKARNLENIITEVLAKLGLRPQMLSFQFLKEVVFIMLTEVDSDMELRDIASRVDAALQRGGKDRQGYYTVRLRIAMREILKVRKEHQQVFCDCFGKKHLQCRRIHGDGAHGRSFGWIHFGNRCERRCYLGAS